MKRKKGGGALSEYKRRRKLNKSMASFISKGRYRVGRAILELLDDYEEGIIIERIPFKIRDHLPRESSLRRSEIVWYAKAVILDLEASGLVERYEDWWGWRKYPFIRLQ